MSKIFKKVIIVLLTVILFTLCCFWLTGCNKQIFDIDYEFNYWYDYTLNETFEVNKWKDYDGEQLQLTLKDGTVILVSSMNGILYSGTDSDKFEK